MTKYTKEWREQHGVEENIFFFRKGVVATTKDESSCKSSRYFLGDIFDRTLRYVLWGV